MRKQKKKITIWHTGNNHPKKQSKLQCYLALNRGYTVADYLTTVTDPKWCTDSVSIALLLRKAAVGRHGSREKTGYVLTAHKLRWKLSCTS
jgi:hypothetical protein